MDEIFRRNPCLTHRRRGRRRNRLRFRAGPIRTLPSTTTLRAQGADDVILSAGYRLGRFEVESALMEHPGVLESGVVSSPDAERGEVVKAFVVLSKGYSASERLAKELQDHAKKATAPYKHPRKLEFVTELPKTVSGKIRRVELRAREWGSG